LKVDTQLLSDVSFRTNSVYQFIGELLVCQENNVCWHSFLKLWSACLMPEIIILLHLFVYMASLQVILQARIGRNVDGLDLNLYQQSLLIRRQHKAKLQSSRRPR
jgi:hypothetical protein